MALRDQPYLPLYIQDFLTDEKLAECSAESTGVYIRLMCLFHKSDPYGKILLKQKYKQNRKQILNFASQVAKNLPYDLLTVEKSLVELLQEDVIQIDGDFIYQKRMVKDGLISDKRAAAGGKGGKKTQGKNKDFASKFAKAKNKANTENEIENEYNNSNRIEDNVGNKNGVPEKMTNRPFKPNEGHISKIILPEIKANSVIMLVSSTRSQKIELEQVFSLFEVFKIQNFTGDKEYKNEAAIHTHFINWAKTQDFTAAEKKAQKYVIWVVPNTGSESKVTIEEWERMIKLNPELKAKRYE